MLFSKLQKIIANKATFVGFSIAIAPIAPLRIRTWLQQVFISRVKPDLQNNDLNMVTKPLFKSRTDIRSKDSYASLIFQAQKSKTE